MILGIKTTGEVSKLKTKTTDGVVKAVECACCGCNPDALWGPGYDDQPSEIQLFGYTLQRVSNCRWQLVECRCGPGYNIVWLNECSANGCLDYDGGLYVESRLNHTYLFFWAPIPGSGDSYPSAEAVRTSGDHPAPYGVYTVDWTFDNLYDDILKVGDTITISPP